MPGSVPGAGGWGRRGGIWGLFLLSRHLVRLLGVGIKDALAEDCALQIGALQLTSPKGVHPGERAGQPLDASQTACCKKAYLEPNINQHVK